MDNKRKSPSPAKAPETPETKMIKREIFSSSLQPGLHVKSSRDMGYVLNLLQGPPAILTMKDVGNGLFTIVYINKIGTNKEAYASDTYDAFMEQLRTRGSPFVRDSGLIAIGPRRVSKESNERVKCDSSTTNDDNNVEKVLIFALTDKSPNRKKSILYKIQDFVKIKLGIDCEVSRIYDTTDHDCQALDHYITDEAIIHLLRICWKRAVNNQFYFTESNAVTRAFFSEPYPPVATAILGYPDADAHLCFYSGDDEGDKEKTNG